MVRSRLAFLAIGLALLIVSGVPGHGQAPTPVSGVVVDDSAPPAIIQGLSLSSSRSPDSPEVQLRNRIHREGSIPDRVSASGARYVAGQVIVKFRDGTSVPARLSALSKMSVRSSTRPAYANFDVVNIDPSADAEAAARELMTRPDVEYAQAVYRVRTQFVPNDPFYAKQWNLPDIDMERAWDIQPMAGSTVTVAVLDTGIAYTQKTMRYHANAFTIDPAGNVNIPGGIPYPALGDLTLPFVAAPDLGPSTRFVSPHDFIWDTDLPLDLESHGTHVSGTIGQTTNNSLHTAGVAFNVKLMPVKVISAPWDEIFGSPHFGTDDVVARGIRYAADNRAKVINMSIGRTGPSGCGTNRNLEGCAPVIEDAIRYAVCSGPKSATCSGQGVFVAVAAGNDFEDGNPTEVIAEIAGRVPGAVSVGATDRGHNRAYYSSTGTWVKVSAPGGAERGFGFEDGGIWQETLNFDLINTFTSPPSRLIAPRFDAIIVGIFIGTSQATSHVSGLAAMLVQQGITDPVAIESALERFATPRGGTTGRNNEFGFGEINARNTLRGLGLAK